MGQRLTGNSECSDEGYSVGAMAAAHGSVVHEGADRVVAAQMSPDFLFDQVRRF